MNGKRKLLIAGGALVLGFSALAFRWLTGAEFVTLVQWVVGAFCAAHGVPDAVTAFKNPLSPPGSAKT